jgi:branched-chain amino acid transport system permease protein
MGILLGAVVGGLLLGIAESLGTQFVPTEFHDALFFGIIVAVLIFRPRGLFGIQERAA